MSKSRGVATAVARAQIAPDAPSPRPAAGADHEPATSPSAGRSSRDHPYTLSLAEQALELIKTHRLQADPPSFEVWYTYAGRFIPGFNQSLNTALDGARPPSIEEIEQIYAHYVSSARLGERVESIGEKIEGHVGNVLSNISAALGSAHEYSENLAGLDRRLVGSADAQSLRAIIDTLSRATAVAEERNKTFETQLEASQGQIKLLQANLEAVYLESRSDSLTSLANRKMFDQCFAAAAAHAKKTGEPVSLLMCDIDHFKYFNDTYGHTIGDDILRLIASAIKQLIRKTDVAARYGGEEFAVIMANTALPTAMEVAERIRTSVMGRDVSIRSTGKSLGRVTISIGAAQLLPTEEPLAWLDRADSHLYAAKRNGRNKVVGTA
jgi:diguanylate cyclase